MPPFFLRIRLRCGCLAHTCHPRPPARMPHASYACFTHIACGCLAHICHPRPHARMPHACRIRQCGAHRSMRTRMRYATHRCVEVCNRCVRVCDVLRIAWQCSNLRDSHRFKAGSQGSQAEIQEGTDTDLRHRHFNNAQKTDLRQGSPAQGTDFEIWKKSKARVHDQFSIKISVSGLD